MTTVKSFDDETILKLFGAQAAEDEAPERLKSYFIRNKSYERLKADIPLRLVIGHKGIGKSALLKMAYLEDLEDKTLAIWLQPNDISQAWSVDGDFVERVEKIKEKILKIVAEKSLDALEIFNKPIGDNAIIQSARHLFSILSQKLQDTDGTKIDVAIAEKFLKTGIVRVYIDDIDRGWAATPRDVQNISALINAARDLKNQQDSRRLQFRIGIRTDAYNLVREDNESGDKFEPYQILLAWSNHDILALIAKRVADFTEDHVEAAQLLGMEQREIAKYLHPVIVERFEGSGHWANAPIYKVLLSLTRERPRDLVKLLWGAAQKAEIDGSTRISTRNLTDSFPDYSKGRIADLISEFKSELPQIERVLYSMKPTKSEYRSKEKPSLYKNDELISKLNSIASNQSITLKSGRRANGQLLAQFLYKIDFVVARRDEDGFIRRYYYRDHSKLQSNFVDFGFSWEIHPAYRWALNPSSIDQLLEGIELSPD